MSELQRRDIFLIVSLIVAGLAVLAPIAWLLSDFWFFKYLVFGPFG